MIAPLGGLLGGGGGHHSTYWYAKKSKRSQISLYKFNQPNSSKAKKVKKKVEEETFLR
jgi:hypothetical protein